MVEPCPSCGGSVCIMEVCGESIATVGCLQAYMKPKPGEAVCETHPTVFSEVGREDAIDRWNAWARNRKEQGGS